MLNPEDRRAIEGLFDRLSAAEQKAPDRDREAVDLIEREIARQPAAPYYMAQTILVQQHALEVAERRIEELEQKARDSERSVQRRGPWDRADDAQNNGNFQRGFGGGGFLGGAMQTALGVAGGVLLGSAIGSLLGGGSAQAAEAGNTGQDAGNENVSEQDQGGDQGDAGDSGSDWGDFGGGDGGFDMGGDF